MSWIWPFEGYHTVLGQVVEPRIAGRTGGCELARIGCADICCRFHCVLALTLASANVTLTTERVTRHHRRHGGAEGLNVTQN